MRNITYCTLLVMSLMILACDGNPKAARVKASLVDISNGVGLPIPSTAEIAQYVTLRRHFDPAWAAKLIVSSSDYAHFEESILEKQSFTGEVMGAASSLDWWDPQNIVLTRHYFYGRKTVLVIVTQTETGYVLYMEWFVS